MSLEGREDDAAIVRLVMVVKQVLGHGTSLPPPGREFIGAAP
jgi:hypothetical protein